MEQTKVVAFVGIESYDLIHYLSRLIRKLGGKSLLVDYSDSRSLAHTINNPLVPDGEIVDYRGVDFITDSCDENLFSNYDYVFIDFGFNTRNPYLKHCEEIYFVTDLQRQNAARLRLVQPNDDQYCSLVIREMVSSKVGADAIKAQLPNISFSEDDSNVYEIYADTTNTSTALSIQYDNVFQFNRVSSDVKEFLFGFLSVDYDEKKLKAAFKAASKGK